MAVVTSTDRELADHACAISGAPVRTFHDKRPNRKTSYSVQLGGRPVRRLLALGLTARKSLTALFPDVAHAAPFVRGYFDGDGTVGVHDGRLVSGFEGSIAFLTELQARLADVGITPKKLLLNQSIHRFRLNHADSLRLASFMYADNGPCLTRKRERFGAWL